MKQAYRLVGLFCVVWCVHAQLQSQTFTIEEILSAPFASDLVAAQEANRLAWVFNHEGRQNIWVASGPEYRARQLTTYELDDGLPLSTVAMSPDGEILVYTYGSPFNPTSHPQGVRQYLRAIRFSGKESWTIAEGSNPVISPDGRTVLFTHQGRIFSAPVDGSAEPEELFRARGSNHSFQWSPDGTRILFVSSRQTHSFVGIYHIEENRIQWIAPDVYRDVNPVWSIDGNRVAFIRTPPGKHQELPPWRRADLPFSIIVAEVATGECQTVWQTDTGGGFAQTYPDQPLHWVADNRLIVYSEHTGWMHIYSISIDDNTVIPLTVGDYEVEHLTVTPDRRTVVFTSNKDDIDRRHIWSVPITGGTPRLLTPGEGIEWSPVVTSDGRHIAFFQATSRRPGQPAIIPLEGGVPRLIARESIPDRFPLDAQVDPSEIILTAADGMTVHAQLFLPHNLREGERAPAIIYMHGGPIRQMYLGWHDRAYYHYNYAFNQYLANRGFIVLSVNFRSGIGYGADFRTAANQGPRGASEYQDILAAAAFLRERPDVDADRIGLWGGSYGGYLTALGLARNSDLFAAGVDLHGVHDWALRGVRRNGGGWAIFTEEDMELAYQSSPVADIDQWTSPVLFIHGDDDRSVDFIQTTDLVRRLMDIGKAHVETLVFPDEVHSFLLHSNWVKTFEVSADFFHRFLGDREEFVDDL